MSDTFDSPVRPWQENPSRQEINIFDNLKSNLSNYERIYKKHNKNSKSELTTNVHVNRYYKMKTEVSYIPDKNRSRVKALDRTSYHQFNQLDRSKALFEEKREPKILPYNNRKYTANLMTSYKNKENCLFLVTERKIQKQQNILKPLVLNFNDLQKYKRMSKRQIHKILFNKAKAKKIV